LIGSWAVKFPALSAWHLFLLGLLGNMQERQFSKLGWPELCPVTWSIPGGWLVVMRRALPLTRDEFQDLDFDEFRIKDEYTVPVENKLDSFGWIDGRLVAVDYG